MKLLKKIFRITLVFISLFALVSFVNTKVFAISIVDEVEQDFSDLSTDKIVEIIIDEEIDYINFFSNINIGINKFKINNCYYNELTNRNDADEIIEELLDSVNLTIDEKYKLELLLGMINNTINMTNVNESLLTVNLNDNIFTPNGSIVEYAYYSEDNLTDYYITKYHNSILSSFETLTDSDYISPASTAYNCHSYAWYKQDATQNNYCIGFPTTYINDSSYIEVSDVRPGDIICYWAYGWNYMKEEGEVGYYITHSAIVVSGTINLSDNTTLSNLNLISKWGSCGVYTHNGDECPYGTKDLQFRYVKAYRPRTNNTYTLTNYSSTINNSLIVDLNTKKIDLYKMYELDIKHTKYYEFKINTNDALDVRLYDEHMQLMNVLDLSNDLNNVHYIEQLYNTKTYYLRVAYANEDSTGTINTKIISRNTAYLGIGENDILLNSYNGFRNYNYINQNNPGFYKFTLVGEKKNNSTIIYPSSALKIYGDANKTQLLQRLDLDEYDNSASIKQNENDMYVYLPWRGYFYLDVNFNAADLKSLKLVITEVTSKSLNLFDLAEDANESINVINETKKGDYFKELNLKQTGKFTLTFNYSGIQNDNIFVVLTKQNYNATTAEYLLDTKFIILLNKDNPIYTYTMSLEDGKYYIGYFNKTDTSRITATFERLVTQSGSEVLVTDPDQGTLCGSQINIIEMNHSNKSYRENYITVGFTRLIYPDYNYGISPSRLDYNWYSSNTSIATVTNYGTVLGKSLGTVKIMAVLKSDPSRVYVKEFTIIEDISYNTVEVHSTYTVKYSRDVVNGKFHFDMEKINCPYPWLQDYTWSLNNNCHNDSFSASMDHWGDITINGTGCFTLTGTYNVNRKYKVIIHFVIEP